MKKLLPKIHSFLESKIDQIWNRNTDTESNDLSNFKKTFFDGRHNKQHVMPTIKWTFICEWLDCKLKENCQRLFHEKDKKIPLHYSKQHQPENVFHTYTYPISISDKKMERAWTSKNGF